MAQARQTETGLQQHAAFIRIGYSSNAFNPFNFASASGSIEDDTYMGVRMIKKMVETVNDQRAYGVDISP